MKILESASKIVLLLFAVAMIAGLFTKNVTGDHFMTVVVMVFTYYFTKRTSLPGDKNA